MTEAAWRVIVREGLDRASIRAIAQELGCTTGVVTHYFRDKDALMIFALERVFENLFQQMSAAAQEKSGIARLEQMIFSVLPLQPGDEQGWLIWIAFLGYAIGRDRLIQEHRKRYESLRQLICETLIQLQKDQVMRPEIDLLLEANALVALVDGIGTGFVINPEQFSPDQQRYLIQRYINDLLVVKE